MSAKIVTCLVSQTVHNLVIDSDVEYQLRSLELKRRLRDRSLPDGSIELYLKCTNLTAIGWGKQQPFNKCTSLLCVDLSGCPKLESIPQMTFVECHHLASAVFGEHSNITSLGSGAFGQCYALTSITLPNKLKVIEAGAFGEC